MRITTHAPALALAPAGLAGCARPAVVLPIESSETTIDADNVPPQARDRLRSLAAGSPLGGWETEQRNGRTVYVAEWLAGPLEHEATVLADGTVLETECDLDERDPDALPDAIRARIAALRAEGYDVRVSLRQFLVYDIDATFGRDNDDDASRTAGPDLELLLRPDGRPATR